MANRGSILPKCPPLFCQAASVSAYIMGEEASVAEYKQRRTVDSKWRGLSSMYLYTSVSKHGWFNQQKWI